MTSEHFAPNYAVAAGETIAEWLEERGMTQAELSARINMSEKALSQIISGTAPLTRATAIKLEPVTGIRSRTWNNLEARYQEELERLERERVLAAQSELLTQVPVAQLRKHNIITTDKRDVAGTVRQLLEFFRVSDSDAWKRLWMGPQTAALRQSRAYTVDPGAVATWLRLGELEAEKLDLADFDATLLRKLLPTFRALTPNPDPADFAENLVRHGGSCGVAIVFVPEIAGARAAGATRWVHGHPIVQLSLRYKSDDQFWFAFFHEIGHILLHGRKAVFIHDGKTIDDAHAHEEVAANQFARDLLIPRNVAEELPTLTGRPAIRAFAERIGVSPGIVLGRLQHDQLIPRHEMSDLKERWELGESDPE
jgi:HTH-type transcriptional regulator/antitoxin HigA